MVVGRSLKRRLCGRKSSRGGVVVLAWFVMSREEVGRLVVFSCLVRLGLGQSEGNDPVLLRQELRRSG